jgi:hypothetical protein
VRDAERAIRGIVGATRDRGSAARSAPGRTIPGSSRPGRSGLPGGPVDIVLEDRGVAEPSRDHADAVAAVDRLTEEGATEAIVLLHTWPPQALDSLPAMIDGMRRGGAAFVDVAALGSARWIASA